jgi:hypothetical protein
MRSHILCCHVELFLICDSSKRILGRHKIITCDAGIISSSGAKKLSLGNCAEDEILSRKSLPILLHLHSGEIDLCSMPTFRGLSFHPVRLKPYDCLKRLEYGRPKEKEEERIQL